ncbi:MAG: SDR family oxidoreductase [Betaproteobacteria bacterium]|nr:SDR family oxidoreductase [Betaproteobacteria bacterium]
MRVMVTGASYGIGGATCLKIARDAAARGEKAKIVATATGRRPDLLELIAELKSLGADAKAITGDLSDEAMPKRLVDEAVEFCGGLDGLVSNAAGRHQAPLAELEVKDWDRMLAINVRATWLLGKAALPALKASQGAIVAVTSIAGTFPHANYGPYSVSKAALICLIAQMAQEWGPHGVRINGVAPGITRTRNSEVVYWDAEVAAKRAAVVPLRRVAMAAEQAAAITFLLSKEASYINGQNLTVDGGFAQSIMAFVPGRLPPSQSKM